MAIKKNNNTTSGIIEYISSLKKNGQKIRYLVQTGFLVLVLWIGYEFYGFVQYHQSGGETPYFQRPPGVEAFLPISALISLKYWMLTGVFNTVHPSALVIFIIVLLVGLLLKKGFCSWVCTISLISEVLWRLGQKIFRKNLVLPKLLDYPLRSIKYLLLAFFLYAISWAMDAAELKKFIYSPYHKVADVKMLFFFTDISEVTLWTLVVLSFLSILIKNFWCRYLCPYGALIGLLSMLSPVKITRDDETCTNCRKCTNICPNSITVHDKSRIVSAECSACALCIDACPVKDTLQFKTGQKSRPVPVRAFAITIVTVFILGTSVARLSGHWQNGISDTEYRRRINEIDNPVYGHHRGKVPDYTEWD